MKKRILYIFLFSVLSLVFTSYTAAAKVKPIKFAWLSDIHFNSFEYAEDDLRQAIEDINANDEIAFVIFSGDLTEFGATDEFARLKEILDNLNKPYIAVTGNHDVNWSENGCTAYEKYFGSQHFVYDIAGVRFIGCGAGPMLRMGAPCIPREEIEWLNRTIESTNKNTPLFFINHFPMDNGVTNSREIIDILKKRNIQFILCGHEHQNSHRTFNGIKSIIGRSLLRRKDPIGGYNICTLADSTVSFNERIIKTETKPKWHAVKLRDFSLDVKDAADTDKISYAINEKYPQIEERWRICEKTDIASQGEIDGDLYVYTTTTGYVKAINAITGEAKWERLTEDKIFSAPFIDSKSVFISSCDGKIYALKRDTGTLIWIYDTGYPIVASPLIKNETLYIGSSNGKFYALNANSGEVIWCAEGLEGYIESRPAADDKNVYIGTWGAKFYALDRKNGKIVWKFDTGRGRYFSPGACWPVIINGNILVQSSDYFMRAFSQEGTIVWQTDKPKGREAVGYSPDYSTLYIQGIGNNITAFDITSGNYSQKWEFTMPYDSNFISTRSGTDAKHIYIPSAFGTVYAINANGDSMDWEYKVSNSAITSFCTTHDGDIIVMTMDGIIVKLSEK